MEAVVNKHQLQQYYKNKKVFVTGDTGFKGSWLVALLHALGAQVRGYALAPEYDEGLYSVLMPLQLVDSIIADIRDKERLQTALIEFEPDYVFHLAAQPLVRRSYEIPAETFDINVTGTANVLEAILKLQNKCSVVVITTDKVYENKEQDILYKEEDRLGGYDPYSASKACTEMVVSSFRKSFFNNQQFGSQAKAIASARAGNVIGGGDWSKDRIIPDIVKALQQDTKIDVRNPSSVRPWQHVLEPLCGYLLLGALQQTEPDRISDAYNFGPQPEDHLTVQQLVELAIQVWGAGTWNDISNAAQPHEAHLLKLDITKALNELNWQPKMNAAQAIEWTINWYKQSQDKRADCTFKQINDYLAL